MAASRSRPLAPCHSTRQGAIDPFFDLLDETKLPEGAMPLPYPAFPPLPGKLHYRSRAGGREASSSGGGGPQGGGGGGGGGGR